MWNTGEGSKGDAELLHNCSVMLRYMSTTWVLLHVQRLNIYIIYIYRIAWLVIFSRFLTFAIKFERRKKKINITDIGRSKINELLYNNRQDSQMAMRFCNVPITKSLSNLNDIDILSCINCFRLVILRRIFAWIYLFASLSSVICLTVIRLTI